MAMVPNYKCPPIKNRVHLIIANKTEAKRQKMWLSWQSGHFQYQRTTVQIQSSAKNYIEHEGKSINYLAHINDYYIIGGIAVALATVVCFT